MPCEAQRLWSKVEARTVGRNRMEVRASFKHVWHGSRCDVARKSAGNKPLISSTSTYPINQSSLNAYCSGISSVIKPKLADISINPINWFIEIPSGRNNCAETKSLGAIIFYPSSSWKNFEKNCESEGGKLDWKIRKNESDLEWVRF